MPRCLACLALLLAVAAGCAPTRAQQVCVARCTREKNDCLVAAGTAEAVNRCDAAHVACTRPCQDRNVAWKDPEAR